jgi:hypothetical protein
MLTQTLGLSEFSQQFPGGGSRKGSPFLEKDFLSVIESARPRSLLTVRRRFSDDSFERKPLLRDYNVFTSAAESHHPIPMH